jgi:hypothetical protein
MSEESKYYSNLEILLEAKNHCGFHGGVKREELRNRLICLDRLINLLIDREKGNRTFTPSVAIKNFVETN